jgi:hypothetical protein
MTLPFALPAWLPWWLPIVMLVPGLLWILAFLAVPFSVVGLKARLDGLEAQLDDIHAEIRTLMLRMPESGRAVDFDELYTAPKPDEAAERGAMGSRPPIPPPLHELEEPEDEDERAQLPDAPRPDERAEPPSRAERRLEPRLDWPR